MRIPGWLTISADSASRAEDHAKSRRPVDLILTLT